MEKINKLSLIQNGSEIKDSYVYIYKKKIIGYVFLINNKIDWIYSKKGYGTDFLKKIEKAIFKKYNKIVFNVSIEPNEKKETVLRRINFYIKNGYCVGNVKFRKKYGTLFIMFKKK